MVQVGTFYPFKIFGKVAILCISGSKNEGSQGRQARSFCSQGRLFEYFLLYLVSRVGTLVGFCGVFLRAAAALKAVKTTTGSRVT